MFAHNLVIPLRPAMSERRKVFVARAFVVVLGVLAFVLALSAEGVYELVAESSSFGSAGIFVVATVGLFSRWGGTPSALASLLGGVAAWVLGAYVLALPHPYLVSLAAAVVGYLVGGLVRSARFQPAGPSTRS